MRDYVLAVRACFSAFRTGRGGYEGEFYQIRRPAFQPGGEELAQDPPIYLGAVNPFMTRIAGEVADGLAAHPFTTPGYLGEVLRPALAAGAERAGRPAPPVLLQLVVAPTREAAAAQMYTYAVPAYRRVLDHAGLDQAAERIFSSGREEARHLIAEHCLDHLGVIIGDDLETGLERWAGLAERITLSVPWFGTPHPEQLTQIERLIARLR
jgi:alkanesulfonate monooxygenase SsuD/methylene tetrahydromethanopterin reductase-like flavin-dependent oxidoreductase (luciferase family)